MPTADHRLPEARASSTGDVHPAGGGDRGDREWIVPAAVVESRVRPRPLEHLFEDLRLDNTFDERLVLEVEVEISVVFELFFQRKFQTWPVWPRPCLYVGVESLAAFAFDHGHKPLVYQQQKHTTHPQQQKGRKQQNPQTPPKKHQKRKPTKRTPKKKKKKKQKKTKQVQSTRKKKNHNQKHGQQKPYKKNKIKKTKA
jgi:hypothetical protein